MRMSRLTHRRTLAVSAFALFAVSAAPLGAWAQTAPAAPAAPPASVAAPAAPAGPSMETSPNLVASGSITATLKASPDFTILSKALEQAQLAGVLNATPGLTLFAPTDTAFKALPAGELAALLKTENAPVLQKLLVYHLVNLSLDGAKIKGAKGPVPSVETSQLQLDGSGAVLKVNDADIIQADVKASNGIIHVVDKVLIPTDVTLPAPVAVAASGTPKG